MAKKIVGEDVEKSLEKRAKNIYSLFNAANNQSRQNWQYFSNLSSDFFNDKHMSKEELKMLWEAEMPSFTINRITPVVETAKYFLTGNDPRWKVIGMDGSGYDYQIAKLHNGLASYCWQLSDGKAVYNQVIHDSIVKQCGYFQVYVDKNEDRGMGEVLIGSIQPEFVFVDGASRDRFYRDASYILVAKNMSKFILYEEFPQHYNKIKAAGGNPIGNTALPYWSDGEGDDSEYGMNIINPETGEQEEEISYFELYRRVKVPYVSFQRIVVASDKEMEFIKKDVSTRLEENISEIKVTAKEQMLKIEEALLGGSIIQERADLEKQKVSESVKEQISQLQQNVSLYLQNTSQKIEDKVLTEKEYNVLMEDPEFKAMIIPESVRHYFEQKIKLEQMVGDKILETSILPVSMYPIIPVPFIHTGNPYPLGLVKYLIGKQQEINKSHQIMVHHANLTTNPTTDAPYGSIIDLEDWKQNSTIPGGVREYNIINGEKPTEKVIGQLNNAFFTITEQGKTELDYMAGIFPNMMGAGQLQTNEPFRTTMAMDEFGTRRLKTYLKTSVDPALTLLGKVFKEFAQNLYTAHKVWKIVSPDSGNNNTETVEYEINKPVFSADGEIIGKIYDYQSSKFDVQVVSGSVWPVSPEAIEQKYYQYLQGGAVDRVAFIKNSTIEDKQELMQRFGEQAEAKQQISQLEEELKSMQGDNQTLRRQVIQANIKLDELKGSLENKKDVLETEAMLKNLQNKMKTEFDLLRRELKIQSKSKNKS